MSDQDDVSKILAIRMARLGDVTLLLPALRLLKSSFAGAELVLMTGLPCEPLARMCPTIDDVIAVDRRRLRDGPRIGAIHDILRLVRQLRAQSFDLVVDFHSFRETNLMAWASGARYRIAMRRSDRAYLPFCFNLPPASEDKRLHVAEMFRRVALAIPGVEDAKADSSPSLRVPVSPSPGTVRVALFVGASVRSRRWPADRFAALAGYLVREWSASIVVLSGTMPEEQEAARQVGEAVGEFGQVTVSGALTIPELAESIASASILVSNDSGPMHIGSALGVPTLGILSESLPMHYRPVGIRDRYIWVDPVDDVGLLEVVKILEDMRAEIASGCRGHRPVS